ncbi:MAG: hypothetical protein ACPG49_05270 [Chitinophagales bacterium]
MKNSILLLLCIFFAGHSMIAQEEDSLIETDMIEVNGFFDVKTTVFTFKKVDDNHRIVAFSKEDLSYVQTFFQTQEGVLKVEGDQLDKTLKVVSLLEKDGKLFFEHQEIATILNRDGFITIRLRSHKTSQYLVAVAPPLLPDNEMTAELISAPIEEKPEDCNECGDIEVSKEVLDLLKNMDFGGEMFDMSSDSTHQPKPSTTDM